MIYAASLELMYCVIMVKTFFLSLRERPFNAIKNGTKNIDIRANKPKTSSSSVIGMNPGDIIFFQKENSDEKLQCTVARITLYASVRELLLAEGTKYSLSSTNDLKKGIASVESIDNYKEIISKNGVFAIKLKDVKIDC